MQPHRQDLYRKFLDYVANDIQGERRLVNRRMFSVLLWCFLLPLVFTVTIMVLVQVGILPRTARSYVDWLIVVFPILYTVYVLSSEVLTDIPSVFRRGGIANSLRIAEKDSVWRERVCKEVTVAIKASGEDWRWLASNFRMDLRKMQYRIRYLTAFAGAVLFLITKGIDMLGEHEPTIVFEKHPQLGWLELSSNDFSLFMGLGLFLILLYLSGSQTYNSLLRYLDCAELMRQELNSMKDQRSP